MNKCSNCGTGMSVNKPCILCGGTDPVFTPRKQEPKERVSVLISAHFTSDVPGLKSELIHRIVDMERKLK